MPDYVRLGRDVREQIMRITPGCFSFLPDLTDEQISRQVRAAWKGWAVNIEFTDDPHPGKFLGDGVADVRSRRRRCDDGAE
jgi:hypothetical protein